MVVGIWSRWKMSLRQSRGKECTSCVVLQQSRERERHAVWRSAVWWPLHACSRWAASCSLTCVAHTKTIADRFNSNVFSVHQMKKLKTSLDCFSPEESSAWQTASRVALGNKLRWERQRAGSFSPHWLRSREAVRSVCVRVCTLALELITWQLARAPENTAERRVGSARSLSAPCLIFSTDALRPFQVWLTLCFLLEVSAAIFPFLSDWYAWRSSYAAP